MWQSIRASLAVLSVLTLALTLATCGGTEGSQSSDPPDNPPGGAPVTEAILYVANVTAETVSAYRVDSNGKLTPVPGSPFSGTADHITSNGSNLVFTSCDHIEIWTAANDGVLTRVSTSSESVNGSEVAPGAMDVSPDGRHLYVRISAPEVGILPFDIAANGNIAARLPFDAEDVLAPDVSADGRALVTSTMLGSDTGVRSMLRDSNGALTAAAGVDLTGDPAVRNAAVSPSSAVVAVGLSDGVALFNFDASTGAFAQVSGSPFRFSGTMNHIAWDATGGFIVAASDNGIRLFRVSNGAISEVAGQPAAEGTLFVAVSSNNRVFATHSDGTVSAFRLDTASGVLARTDGPVQAGNGALEMTILRR